LFLTKREAALCRTLEATEFSAQEIYAPIGERDLTLLPDVRKGRAAVPEP
jgi:hypothetical protein